MANKNTVDTAQKGQTTTKNNIPTGKVKTLANATERRKAREEQFRNFRINALKRRCKRYGFDEAKTNEYVEALKKQMDAPKEYNIMISFDSKDFNMMKEAVTKANIKYRILVAGNGKARVSYGYMSLIGDQKILDKLREIAPPSAKIYPYAKKMESVIPAQEKEVIKKPSNNTAEKKAAAKLARKAKNMRVHVSDVYKDSKGRFHKRRKPSPRPNAGTNKTKVKIGKRAWLKANSTQAILSLSDRIRQQKAITIQLKAKKSSTGSKKASTNLKKAA